MHFVYFFVSLIQGKTQTKMENLTLEERNDLLQEAMEALANSVDLLQTALRGTSHYSHANSYIIPHLRGWIDGCGSYNMGIQQYMDSLCESEEEED